jgi:hypothetical protein
MTCEIESGRQDAPAIESGEVSEAATCGLCGEPIGSRPRLHFMRVENGKLRDLRVCPVCFLMTVMEARA